MKQQIIFLSGYLMLMLASCQNNKPSGNQSGSDSGKNRFGDSVAVSNGLEGKVFLLPDTTRTLPDFDTMKPLDKRIYVKEINVPWQSWSAGFPGLRDRFEWFGIEYNGQFKPVKSGTYEFKLNSDDGSKLYIDDSLVINNDGVHSEWPVKGKIHLSDSLHTIRLRYFQGPKYSLALQLFWSLDGTDMKIFPGMAFILYPPKPPSFWWIWLLIALGLVLAGLAFYYNRRKKQKQI